jgi:antitoxin VapB
MGLNIRDAEVERLVSEVALLAHETETETIRRALMERKARLQAGEPALKSVKALMDHLEHNVWPLVPPHELGRVLSRQEENQILGFGPEGV